MLLFFLLLACSSNDTAADIEILSPYPPPPPLQSHRPAPSKVLSLSAGGDIMFGRYRDSSYFPVGGLDPFLHLRDKFNQSNLSIVNLETPITDKPPPGTSIAAQRSLLFRAPSSVIDLLQESGINVLIRANNHAEDRNKPGLRDTEQYLNEAGILHTGVALDGADPFVPLHTIIDDVEVVIMAFTMRRNLGLPKANEQIPVAFSFDPNALKEIPPKIEDIRAQYPKALFLVSAHWGEEYRPEPTRTMQRLAHAIIDAGANAVLGHHPHVLQPIEFYKGSPILYSMGNLIFDQTALNKRQTAIFSLSFGYFSKWKILELDVQPMLLTHQDQGPRDATQSEADEFIPSLISLSEKYNAPLSRTEEGASWMLYP